MERQLPKALKSSPTMWKTICPRTVHWTETERPERKGGKKQRAKGRVGGGVHQVVALHTDTMWDVSSSNILIMMTRTHPANLISPTKQSCSGADKLFLFLQPLTTHKIKKTCFLFVSDFTFYPSVLFGFILVVSLECSWLAECCCFQLLPFLILNLRNLNIVYTHKK